MFKDVQFIENDEVKIVKSKNFNNYFNKKSGLNIMFGATQEENPEYSPFGPMIADIEITTVCTGVKQKSTIDEKGAKKEGKESVCKFCYKSNTPSGKHMTLDTFKRVLDKFKIDINGKRVHVLTQIALGADSHGTTNKDTIPIMEFARESGVIPNITIADIDDTMADKLAKVAGGVAVSRYDNKDLCYDSVKRLTDAVLRKKILVRRKKEK